MRIMKSLLILSILLISGTCFGHRVPECPGQEFSIDLKRCTPYFRGNPCEIEDRVRVDGICVDQNSLNLNAEYEIDTSLRNEIVRRAKINGLTDDDLNDFRDHIELLRQRAVDGAVTGLISGSGGKLVAADNDSPREATVSQEDEAPEAAPPEAAIPPETTSNLGGQTEEIDQDQLDENFNVFDPDECEWVESLPRKIHEAPGCGRGSAKVCVGYVACKLKNGEGKFIRASTCDPDHCGSSPSDASACTKDPHFWSKQAEGSSQKYIGSEIRSIIHRGLSQ